MRKLKSLLKEEVNYKDLAIDLVEFTDNVQHKFIIVEDELNSVNQIISSYINRLKDFRETLTLLIKSGRDGDEGNVELRASELYSISEVLRKPLKKFRGLEDSLSGLSNDTEVVLDKIEDTLKEI